MNSVKTTLSRAYRLMYEGICGRYPSLRPWHFQWLAGHYVCGRLKKMLPGFGGRILDVGCADKPFRDWFGAVTEYVGLDVVPGPNVDVVVSSKERWPFPDGYFDVVFSTQVLEHAEHLGITLSEIRRVLKKEGRAVLTFPFLYNEHGNPSDYRRFTVYGAEGLFPDFEIVCLEKQGAIGSTLHLLFLNWLSNCRLLKLLLPLWILLSLFMNLSGILMDRLDHTGAFYHNVLLVAKKRS